MGFWKVLAGAAAGVGLVVALPIAGPIGAVTALGAAVAATGGALAGGVASSMDDDEVSTARHEGRTEGQKAAEVISRAKEERLGSALQGLLEEQRTKTKKEKVLVSLFAIGYSVAACDGDSSDEEKAVLEEFLLGVMGSELLSARTKTKLEKLVESPPSFRAAMALLPEIPADRLWIVDDIIDLVIEQDGRTHPKEVAFREMWGRRRAKLAAA